MLKDPIVTEIHKIREEIAAKFNYDLRAICKDVMKRQYESGRKIVEPKPRIKSK